MPQEVAQQRLQAIQNVLTACNVNTTGRENSYLLILPDGRRVDMQSSQGSSPDFFDPPNAIQVLLDDTILCKLYFTGCAAVLTISGVGTPHEHIATHIPRYPVLEVLPVCSNAAGAPSGQQINLADMWIVVYALFTQYHEQETVPIVLFAGIGNRTDLRSYILRSGLGRTSPSKGVSPEVLFLMRAAFWQAAGQVGYHELGWTSPHLEKYASPAFPAVQSFTRNQLVITAHPLRPPKPEQGEVLYRRYCPSVGQVLEFKYFDLGAEDHCSAHLEAFHRWHNDERVSKAWNEQGSMVQHREYVMRIMDDPAILPIMMSWGGELMGYAEVVWLKENHVATYVPDGAKDWDRGVHVLVGEERFRGSNRARAWMRSLHHYCFLADPRTEHIVAEPRADNDAVIKVLLDATMHIATIFDFPYKRSVMTHASRERFFKTDVL